MKNQRDLRHCTVRWGINICIWFAVTPCVYLLARCSFENLSCFIFYFHGIDFQCLHTLQAYSTHESLTFNVLFLCKTIFYIIFAGNCTTYMYFNTCVYQLSTFIQSVSHVVYCMISEIESCIPYKVIPRGCRFLGCIVNLGVITGKW